VQRTALKYIETILETGGITAAAKKLFLSQPSLSQYIRRIEQDHGIELFDRSTQPWVLTEDGQFFLNTERKIQALRRERLQYFQDKHSATSGTLCIGSTQFRSSTVLCTVLPVFRRRFPDIPIHIEEGTSTEIVDLAEKGIVDCALALKSLLTEKLTSEPILGERILICVPNSHRPVKTSERLKTGKYPVAKFSQFADDDFIVLKPGQMFHNFFLMLCSKYRIAPNVILEAQSITTVPSMVEAGLGCALVPSPLAKHNTRHVRYYDVGNDIPVNTLTIAWSSQRYLSRPARAFIDVAKELFQGELDQ